MRNNVNKNCFPIIIVLFFQIIINFPTHGQNLLQKTIPLDITKFGLKSIGRIDTTQNIDFVISLPLRNKDEFKNILKQIYDPLSSNYHHYLTVDQFTSQFGPTSNDYQKIIEFAKSKGLTIKNTFSNNMILELSGAAANIEKAFHINFRLYNHPTESRIFFAPDTEPIIDSSLSILGISGLTNYYITRSRYKHNVNGSNLGTGSGPGNNFMGNDFRAAYVPNVTLTGIGQSVGLVEFDGYSQNDITYYENKAGLPNVSLSNVLLDGFNGQPSGKSGEIEVCLDIEMAISIAPGLSSVIIYEAPPNSATDISVWHLMLNRMAADNLAKQISCSWYIPGHSADATSEQIFMEMAVQGQSFFDASGDDDAYTGLIDYPGDSPNITQVGGTTLTTSGGIYTSETVWNDGDGSGSGGGISTQYTIPDYQASIGMSNNQGSTTMRNIPDVACCADQIYVRADGRDLLNMAGTSFASPLWAGYMALVNQQNAIKGEQSIGFINPTIYLIERNGQYSTEFHDITTGNNKSLNSPNKFAAATGYDLCTGIGTPNGQLLMNNLQQNFVLAYTNKSLDYNGTGDNHNRTLSMGNNLYEAFASGGSIFVRQSSNNGISWNYTSSVSQSVNNNSSPSIVVWTRTSSIDTVSVVWQSSLGSNYYDIYYAVSSNSGYTWSSPTCIENNVLVSSDQMGGPQPVISGVSYLNGVNSNPTQSLVHPMLTQSYTHGLLIVFTSSTGLKYMVSLLKYVPNNWSIAKSIPTSKPGSYIWQPSLSSQGIDGSSKAYLSYDARYYHQIYANIYDFSIDSWSNEVVLYDGSGQSSYDRCSCISAYMNLYAAWMSYNSGSGYYTVKFRQGNLANTWGSWIWTYPGTTGNCYYPSITSYYSGSEKVAITEYTSPGNQILLHKADVNNQTFQTTAVGSSAGFPNLPNINYTSGSTMPVEVWTNNSTNGIYPISVTTQNFAKLNTAQLNHFDIYDRALSSNRAKIEIKAITALTQQGQSIPLAFKGFDYSKQADMTDPWQYLETDNSTELTGVNSITLNLSVLIPGTNGESDSVHLSKQLVNNAVSPTEIDIYNGEQLIYTEYFSTNEKVSNKNIVFPIPGGTILGIKPVLKFSDKSGKSSDLAFESIENTIAQTSNQVNQLIPAKYVPTEFSLRQNYPNPFNPSTMISYDLPKAGYVTLKVYDILGKEITTLFSGNQQAGTYNISCDGSKFPSGVYFYQIKSNNYISIKKMMLVK
jgi:hypothetical protein